MPEPIYSSFQSSDGEYPVVTTTWLPTREPIGVVQIVHGMREHMGRYGRFAEFLNQKGFIVTGHDHLGHGKTALGTGVYGYFGERKGAKKLVDDSALYTSIISENYPDLPLFLLGHSMGSFVSRLQVLKVGGLLSGYLCLGTSGGGAFMPLARVYAECFSKVAGERSSSALLNEPMNRFFGRVLEKDEPWDQWISHDPVTIKEYREDSLTRFYFTNQGYCDLFDLEIACNRRQWYEKYPKNLSIFLMSGSHDPLSNGGAHLPRIAKKLTRIGLASDVKYKVYENRRHEILNEIGYMEVYNDILEWIDHRI